MKPLTIDEHEVAKDIITVLMQRNILVYALEGILEAVRKAASEQRIIRG